MSISAITQTPSSPTGLMRIWKRYPNIIIGGAMLAIAVFAAIAAPWLGTIDPQTIAPFNRLEVPGTEFWFGGDLVGRDVYSRTIYGARISLAVGLGVVVIGIFFGLLIGILSGFVSWVDQILMRVMDGLMAIPSILLAVALISLTGASLKNVIIAISIAEVPRVARLVRSVVLQLKERPYVEAAITAGTPFILILWRHILPNTLAPLLVQATYIFASAVLTEAILSFIGAGTPPSTPSWGNIIAEGRTVFSIAPHIVMFPGIALSFTVLGVNLLGDGLRDIFDPRFVSRT
ncbi:ABC transporter permease [Colwellia sp. 4_MG-2023]|uniref:ABC transporter permease n=1 Tax=unclassified Colwellia TaxID=196834 RepID=UPI0020916033|nr:MULTISPECIES: ABC transporter permease [unclassified Colwellia]MDO6487664.1 ABC transporter permease [Colwellia sp. 6_MG-2023]MDO6506794.1 ABC transporter permease [Colwellia sp. 5_MG-2023]MDO6555831.1 ABC transporter permease [Colwellia sp. 4_MG-2023]MDO6652875.1 ABC transporter permease [Colwellia sp. 3_MG-2023]MDO6665877.1 ABC transporter permease [Colwellia sp. 2_MG-2023]